MRAVAWVVLAVILIAIVAAVWWAASGGRQRTRLRRRFGPEYDRTVERLGDQREADTHLEAIARRRDQLEVTELSPADRAEARSRWTAIQAQFVDRPGEAVSAANTLLTSLMRRRGYPVDNFEERADLIAADHPHVVEHYRQAHSAHRRHRDSGAADTEDLRQAFVHYRELFVVLVGDVAGEDHRVEEHPADHRVAGEPVDGERVGDQGTYRGVGEPASEVAAGTSSQKGRR